jgi:hypothetical protein
MSSVTFVVDSGYFDCVSVKVLKDCNSDNFYYVSDSLIYSSSALTTGYTFLALINSEYKCLTYINDIGGSPSDFIGTIISATT